MTDAIKTFVNPRIESILKQHEFNLVEFNEIKNPTKYGISFMVNSETIKNDRYIDQQLEAIVQSMDYTLKQSNCHNPSKTIAVEVIPSTEKPAQCAFVSFSVPSLIAAI